jgi:hypothetical protein
MLNIGFNDDYDKTTVLNNIRAASKGVSDCIDACVSVYLDDLGPTGATFRNFAQQLLEVERDLFRAEGELLW